MFHPVLWQSAVFALSYLAVSVPVTAQYTWCGKDYMAGSLVVPPGGEFPLPATSSTPLLTLRCTPVIRPYLPEDVTSPSLLLPSAILIDAPITFSTITGAVPITNSAGNLLVSVSAALSNGTSIPLATGIVALNTTKTALPFSLGLLTPSAIPYTLTCSATIGSQTFTSQGVLAYLPTPTPATGSVTRMDLRTGALLARPADGRGSGPYGYVLPVGFYTQFDPYLTTNLSQLNELKSQGINIIHAVPPFDNTTALNAVLDRMEEVGLYLMYDMRFTYMNSTSVTSQVNSVKSRSNLLLWYTGDEPDGTSDPLNATFNSANLIASLDGGVAGSGGTLGVGYHPVSLVLNCQNYYFTEYTQGADIVMQDVYMIGNNVTFSSQWGTVCTPDYGDCGCDNCKGAFEDISDRMDQFRDRLFVNGWERTKAVWTVPQGFGNDTYWKRYPTGAEFLIESILGINHGALGVISWDDPTTPDIKAAASMLGSAVPQFYPFIFNPTASFRHVKTSTRIDLGLWHVATTLETFVLGCNLNNSSQSVTWQELGIGQTGLASQGVILVNGAEIASDGTGIQFNGLGCGAWVLKTPVLQLSSAA